MTSVWTKPITVVAGQVGNRIFGFRQPAAGENIFGDVIDACRVFGAVLINGRFHDIARAAVDGHDTRAVVCAEGVIQMRLYQQYVAVVIDG